MPSSEAVGDSPQPLITVPPAGARDARPGVSGVPADKLEEWFAERGQPAYRARQLTEHLWSGAAQSASELHTLPQDIRAALDADFRLTTLGEADVRPSDNGLTQKALHRLDDGRLIE